MIEETVWRIGPDPSVEVLTKCLLLPMDGSREIPRTLDFLIRLYPKRDNISLILCYFMPQLPPIYREVSESKLLARKKQEQLQARAQKTRLFLDKAKKTLIRAGFPPQSIIEQIQERSISVARQACMLAGIRSVDAVLVQKDSSSSLEAFLKNDPASGMLRHCLTSPIWLVDGTIDVSRAAVCVSSDPASLRAADHAAFMLADAPTQLEILHFSTTVSHPIRISPDELTARLANWLRTPEGASTTGILEQALEISLKAGIPAERLHLSVMPSKGHGHLASEILAYCRRHKIGIVVLGHSDSNGAWGFLRSSVAKRIMAELKDMAVWVNQ